MLGLQRRIGGVIAHHDDQGVAVGLGLRGHLRADHGGGAGAGFDDDRLAPALGHLLPEHARQDIGRSAGRERHDDLDRLFGILVGGRLGGSAGCGESGRGCTKDDCADRMAAPCGKLLSHVSLPRQARPGGARTRLKFSISPVAESGTSQGFDAKLWIFAFSDSTRGGHSVLLGYFAASAVTISRAFWYCSTASRERSCAVRTSPILM